MAKPTSKLVIYAALAGNSAIALVKFAAAAFTGSAAMLSEAIHSVVDTGNQLLLLWGLARAKRPPTPQHPFGHGLQLYFFTFVVAVMIFGVGAVVSILHGLEKIQHPEAIENAWVNYLVLGIGIVFEGAVWYVAYDAFNKERGKMGFFAAIRASKDPTTFTVLFEDTAALLGLVVALIGVAASQLLHMPVLDGIASLVIGLVLAGTAGFLAFESSSLLTGEAADPETRAGIAQIAREHPAITGLNDAITMHFGPSEVFVALSLDFNDDLSAAEVEHAVTEIKRRIAQAFPHVHRIFVEAQGLKSFSEQATMLA